MTNELAETHEQKIALLEKQNQVMKEALQSIASSHRESHSQIEHWKSIKHEDCAEVLATDTQIAREALAACEVLDSKHLEPKNEDK